MSKKCPTFTSQSSVWIGKLNRLRKSLKAPCAERKNTRSVAGLSSPPKWRILTRSIIETYCKSYKMFPAICLTLSWHLIGVHLQLAAGLRAGREQRRPVRGFHCSRALIHQIAIWERFGSDSQVSLCWYFSYGFCFICMQNMQWFELAPKAWMMTATGMPAVPVSSGCAKCSSGNCIRCNFV